MWDHVIALAWWAVPTAVCAIGAVIDHIKR